MKNAEVVQLVHEGLYEAGRVCGLKGLRAYIAYINGLPDVEAAVLMKILSQTSNEFRKNLRALERTDEFKEFTNRHGRFLLGAITAKSRRKMRFCPPCSEGIRRKPFPCQKT